MVSRLDVSAADRVGRSQPHELSKLSCFDAAVCPNVHGLEQKRLGVVKTQPLK